MPSSKHHPFSPSCLERRDLCPGSWEVEAAIPDMTTPEASSGTRIHEAVAYGLSLKDGQSVGVVLQDNEKELTEKCLNFASEFITDGVQVLVEQPLAYYDEGSDEPLYTGTADVVIVLEKTVIVIDWKTGFQPVVEAANNLQGAAYALAAMQRFSKSYATVIFYNPRIGQETSHTFENWRGIRDEIKAIIDRCKAPDHQLCTGEKQCKYCKGSLSGSCPALQAHTLELSASVQVGLIEQLKGLSDEKVLDLFESCKPAQKLIDAVEAEVKERAEKNGACGDYTIKMVSGGFECKDIQQTFRVSGLSPDKFLDCCSVSLPKLKKQYAETAEGMTKKEAEALLMDKIAPYLQAKPERKTLTKVKK